MPNLYTENLFAFAGHGGNEIKVVDDQIIVFHRQIFDVAPKLKGIDLFGHALVVEAAAVFVEQTHAFAFVFNWQLHGQVGIVAAEHHIDFPIFLQQGDDFRGTTNVAVSSGLNGI